MKHCYEFWPGFIISLARGLTIRPIRAEPCREGAVESLSPKPSKVKSRAYLKRS